MTPVHLVIGLLGSGKTTLLQHLLSQKPPSERWGVLVNDFGSAGIDAALLDAEAVVEVAGGCLCCSAQLGLRQGLNRLLETRPDRVFIESSGASHPQPLARELSELAGARLQTIIAVVTPMQLTPERWRRAERLRSLVTLADHVVVNKTDLAGPDALDEALRLLRTEPAFPVSYFCCEHGRVLVEPLLQPPRRPMRIHLPHAAHPLRTEPHSAELPGLIEGTITRDDEVAAFTYRFTPSAIFNRALLNRLLPELPLKRAKGLLRTGMAWNLLQLSDRQLQWREYAWRLDSRLTLFWPAQIPMQQIRQFEKTLKSGITLKESRP